MKPLIIVGLILVVALPVHAHEQFVWLRLVNDRVIVNATFERMSDDSLLIVRGNKKLTVLLQDVKQIRFIQGSSILTGMAIGAGAGLVSGGVIGAIVHSSDPESWSPEVAAVAFAVIGGVVGSVISSFDQPNDLVDLTGKSVDEKREIIQHMLTQE